MTTERLQDLLRATPFRAFDIVMGDGTRYHVPHPEWIAYSDKSRTAVVFDESGRLHILELLLATALEVGGNGQGGAGRRRVG